MSSRFSRFFASFLCFSLLIAFFPMSAIRAEASAPSYITEFMDAGDFRSMLGDSLEAQLIFENIESGETQGGMSGTFLYVDTVTSNTYPVFQYSGDDTLLDDCDTFQSMIRNSAVPVLIYAMKVDDRITSLPNYIRSELNVELNLSFSNVSFFDFTCGFMAYNSANHMERSRYPRNYIAVNGTAHNAMTYSYDNDYYANIMGAYKFTENDEEKWIYPYCPMLYHSYHVDSQYQPDPSTITINRIHGQGLDWWRGYFWMFFVPPYIDTGYQYVPQDKLPSWIQNESILQNTEDIKQLLQVIVSGSGATGLGKDDFVSLWVPSTAQLLTHEQSLRVMLHDTFGSAYDAEELLQDAVDSISEETVEPLTHLDLPALSVPVDGQQITIMQAQEVPLKPDGFDTLFTVIASIIDIVCTFAVVNMLRRRFEKGVLENDG